MNSITLHVLDGVDKGRAFRDLAAPVTIGREEGNVVRLNDERVSRFHAKVQIDQGDLILTDLQSTNGTLVNGNKVQIRRLRHGDCITLGRSVLLFGSEEDIAAEMATFPAGKTEAANQEGQPWNDLIDSDGTTMRPEVLERKMGEEEVELSLSVNNAAEQTENPMRMGGRKLPPLPQQLTPSQAARVAEILELLHRGLAKATNAIQADQSADALTIDYAAWQRILAVEMVLARYLKAIVEPGEMGE